MEKKDISNHIDPDDLSKLFEFTTWQSVTRRLGIDVYDTMSSLFSRCMSGKISHDTLLEMKAMIDNNPETILDFCSSKTFVLNRTFDDEVPEVREGDSSVNIRTDPILSSVPGKVFGEDFDFMSPDLGQLVTEIYEQVDVSVPPVNPKVVTYSHNFASYSMHNAVFDHVVKTSKRVNVLIYCCDGERVTTNFNRLFAVVDPGSKIDQIVLVGKNIDLTDLDMFKIRHNVSDVLVFTDINHFKFVGRKFNFNYCVSFANGHKFLDEIFHLIDHISHDCHMVLGVPKQQLYTDPIFASSCGMIIRGKFTDVNFKDYYVVYDMFRDRDYIDPAIDHCYTIESLYDCKFAVNVLSGFNVRDHFFPHGIQKKGDVFNDSPYAVWHVFPNAYENLISNVVSHPFPLSPIGEFDVRDISTYFNLNHGRPLDTTSMLAVCSNFDNYFSAPKRDGITGVLSFRSGKCVLYTNLGFAELSMSVVEDMDIQVEVFLDQGLVVSIVLVDLLKCGSMFSDLGCSSFVTRYKFLSSVCSNNGLILLQKYSRGTWNLNTNIAAIGPGVDGVVLQHGLSGVTVVSADNKSYCGTANYVKHDYDFTLHHLDKFVDVKLCRRNNSYCLDIVRDRPDKKKISILTSVPIDLDHFASFLNSYRNAATHDIRQFNKLIPNYSIYSSSVFCNKYAFIDAFTIVCWINCYYSDHVPGDKVDSCGWCKLFNLKIGEVDEFLSNSHIDPRVRNFVAHFFETREFDYSIIKYDARFEDACYDRKKQSIVANQNVQVVNSRIIFPSKRKKSKKTNGK